MSSGDSLPADGGSARYARRGERELRQEVVIEPVAELGLVAANGPNDPEPSLEIRDGEVVELDGRRPAEWDVIDRFLARWGIDPAAAEEAAALDDREIARRLVDVDTARADLVRLSRGLTPARLARIAGMLDPVELMFALKKLRARRSPANQAHVTNLKENPALRRQRPAGLPRWRRPSASPGTPLSTHSRSSSARRPAGRVSSPSAPSRSD
jgi:propanediol dehydratase large subunit